MPKYLAWHLSETPFKVTGPTGDLIGYNLHSKWLIVYLQEQVPEPEASLVSKVLVC